MEKIKLTPRLQQVANLVRHGTTVADIGTDHGYLVAYLIQNEIANFAIASDLREGPLSMAKSTAFQCGIANKIVIRLSDGLQSISSNEADDIVVAGMGGELIAEILGNCIWIKDKGKHLVLQPMTHSEDLRDYLCKNDFEIISDIVVREGKKLYNVIETSYSGVKKKYNDAFKYIGKISDFHNDDNLAYLKKTIEHLKKKSIGDDSEKLACELRELEKLI